MLYVFYGDDSKKVREGVGRERNRLGKEFPEAEIIRLTEEEALLGRARDLAESRGLFAERLIVFLNRLLANDEVKEKIIPSFEALSSSPNIFLVTEEKLDAATKKAFKEAGARLEEFSSFHKESKDFPIFSLADKFGERDRKALWVLYEKAIRSGVSPEAIAGVLFWQVRAIEAAVSGESAEALQMKPFTINKARNYAKNFKPGECKNFLWRILSLFHDAHRGGQSLETALEDFILRM